MVEVVVVELVVVELVVVLALVVVVPLTAGVCAPAMFMPFIENDARTGTATAPMAARLRNARRPPTSESVLVGCSDGVVSLMGRG